MKFARSDSDQAPTLSMTSLMDVVFLLLCFFVTTSVFSQWETEIAIALPTAQTSTVPQRLPGEIILNVSETGAVTVNGQFLTCEELTKRLGRLAKFYPGQPVVIRADKGTSYEHVVAVIDACRKADVWNFSLAMRDNQKADGAEAAPAAQ